jgi:hypothetical protein
VKPINWFFERQVFMCVGNAYTLERGWNKVAGGLGNGREERSFSYEFKSTTFEATVLSDLTELRTLNMGQKVFWVPYETKRGCNYI